MCTLCMTEKNDDERGNVRLKGEMERTLEHKEK